MIKAIVTGHIGNVKFVDQAAVGDKPAFSVLNFSVASNATTRDGKDITNWTSCKMWGPRAKSLAPHLVKGQAVAVEGRPEARGYQGEAGVRSELVLHVANFEFVGPKPEAAPAEVAGDPAPDNAPQD